MAGVMEKRGTDARLTEGTSMREPSGNEKGSIEKSKSSGKRQTRIATMRAEHDVSDDDCGVWLRNIAGQWRDSVYKRKDMGQRDRIILGQQAAG